MPTQDATAARKKHLLLKAVRRWNKANPKRKVNIPPGFDPHTPRIGEPCRKLLRDYTTTCGMTPTNLFTKAVMKRLLPKPGIRSEVMATAHAELGTHEWPPGTNRGEVLKYLRAAGIGFGAPWCVSFVYWVLLHSGFERHQLPSWPASTPEWYNFAKPRGCLKPVSKSLMGDIWLYEWGNGDGMLDHGAFCDDPNPRNSTGLSLDGNVGAYGGSVTQVARPAGTIAACIDLVRLHGLK
jgi:hypothetical protein